MKEDYLKLFDTNRDAIATNRGFYYQYLVLLKKWIENYINGKGNTLYSEVEEDIKEIGDKIVFTQVKSFTSKFSFNSNEIKKTIFYFFIHYLKYHNKASLGFQFITNTEVAKSENLLLSWIENPQLNDIVLKNKIVNKIKSILNKELKSKKNNLAGRPGIDEQEINKIKIAADSFKEKIENKSFNFVQCMHWDFKKEQPDIAIKNISKEIIILLEHEKFKGRPAHLIMKVLLCEIYKCSQVQEREKRVLKNNTITRVLENTDIELEKQVNYKLIDLFKDRFEEIKEELKVVQETLLEHSLKFKDIDHRLKPIKKQNNSVPQKLTLIPKALSENIIGYEKSFMEVKSLLEAKKNICISGISGTGKTFFVYKFLELYQDDFQHIIWINSSQSLIHDIAFNKMLIENLDIKLPESYSTNERFQIICNKLDNLTGKKLFIIDTFMDKRDTLDYILSLDGWMILVTTQKILQDIELYKLPKLDFASAYEIFLNTFKGNSLLDENELKVFFQHIDYNPLVIKLTAKTISNSLDMDLKQFNNYLRNQNLDNEDLDIDIYEKGEKTPVRILSFLKKKFVLSNLSEKERYCLEFLALLPSDDILIDDLASIGGRESYLENKKHFTNVINSLHNKGWVERVDGEVKMNRLIQEIIRYNERSKNNPFSSNTFLFIWLFRRIDEVAQTNPIKSFKYLKYADSILRSIKEKYRIGIYQPLLLLENAMLNAYSLLDDKGTLHDKWADLSLRAENYLSKTDSNLGIIYNNLAYSFLKMNDFESAEIYFEKAIKILRVNLPDSLKPLINSLNNITILHIKKGDYERALKLIKRIQSLRNKYSLKEDLHLAIQYNNLGYMCQRKSKFDKAEAYCIKAINTLNSLDEELKNSNVLALSYYNLAYVQFYKGDYKYAILSLSNANKIVKKLNDYPPSTNKVIRDLIEKIKSYSGN